MAFDGVFTCATVRELSGRLTGARIDRIYQPTNEELVLFLYTGSENVKLLISASSSSARVQLISSTPENPAEAPSFCMLLRKQLIGGHVEEVSQHGAERIIEFSIEVLDELGFPARKRLYAEIMGKHSNIILTDEKSGRIIDSIKRISIDVNRPRQILPGLAYEYPPPQDKIPFYEANEERFDEIMSMVTDSPGAPRYEEALSKAVLSRIGGLSPNLATEYAHRLAKGAEGKTPLKGEGDREAVEGLNVGQKGLYIYLSDQKPLDFHVVRLSHLAEASEERCFENIHEGLEYYFEKRDASNRVKQASYGMEKSLSSALDKLYLKKQRMLEDIKKAEDSEKYRLYGELLTANLHLVKTGDKEAKVLNYYSGEELIIPLDVKISAAKNAQNYFKKYAKSRVTIKEKGELLKGVEADIDYLLSVQAILANAADIKDVEAVRAELSEGGYIRAGRTAKARRSIKGSKKPKPAEYRTSGGLRVLVGRSNIENDYLTFKMAGKTDLWLHTKDIHGSHVILFTEGKTADELNPEEIYEAAAIAAYHSKARDSENVPVDYTSVRHVKKPSGAKPGMVIFTDNRTVWVNPKVPEGRS